MKIINNRVLAEFRCCHVCEWCNRPGVTEAAHIFARGFGGGCRLDVPLNLVSLGSAFGCGCHAANHAGQEPTRSSLLALVARRTGLLQDEVEQRIRRMMRAPKECELCACCAGTGRTLGRRCRGCQGAGILDMTGRPWGADDDAGSGGRRGGADADNQAQDGETDSHDGVHRDVPPSVPGGGARVAADESGWVEL